MGTDMLESMGQVVRVGNTTTINLEPDTREEGERLYAALSEGGPGRHRARAPCPGGHCGAPASTGSGCGGCSTWRSTADG